MVKAVVAQLFAGRMDELQRLLGVFENSRIATRNLMMPSTGTGRQHVVHMQFESTLPVQRVECFMRSMAVYSVSATTC